jgi:ssRNA-specific RNase YbeY (16S rRNA maturation enzyme)
VIYHGLLHLCGYKDKSASDEMLMRKKENYYLGLFVSRETTLD